MNYSNRDWSLQDIANWTSDHSRIKIPAIQRGLVWKPKQVELLWDSILRGFPIGCFLLSENSDDTYDLMDGQQRFNAIASAFSPLKDDSQSELWIDIDPNNVKTTTRFYWIKATTVAHPWGFENDDDCNPLPAWKKRSALEKFGKEPNFNIYHDNKKDNLSLFESFPYAAKAPIPLSYMLEACEESTDEEDFADSVLSKINGSNRNFAKNEFVKDREKIKHFYKTFKAIQQYRVYANVINIDRIINDKQENTSNLEILFNRLNKNGTQISTAELAYSAIKAYWPEIRERTNELAQGLMPPEKLVLTIFRLVLTENSKLLKKEPSIEQIRGFAKDNTIKGLVRDKYEQCRKYIEKINDWLGVDENIDSTPSILRSKIIRKAPDLFFLLIFMASNPEKLPRKENIRAYIFYIYFFVDSKSHKDITKSYIENFYSTEPQSLESVFYVQIALLIYKNVFIPTYQRNLHLDELSIQSKENWFEKTFPTPSAQQVFNLINRNYDILLFAQRRFLNKNFNRYLYVTGNIWEDHDTPWDIDHIVPKDWTNQRNSDAIHFCKEWINTIGNLAAIPFAVNRSKSDKSEWEFYKENADTLFFDEALASKITGKTLLKQEKYACIFANYTLQRLQKIYGQLDAVLRPIDFNKVLSGNDFIVERKAFVDGIDTYSNEATSKFYFDNQSQKDAKIIHPLDWCHEFISVGYIINKKYFVATTIQGNQSSIEIGIRKTNEKDSEKMVVTGDLEDYSAYDNKYWFICKNIPNTTTAHEIAQELEKLKKYVLTLQN